MPGCWSTPQLILNLGDLTAWKVSRPVQGESLFQEPRSGKAAHPRRGAVHCGQYRQAAGTNDAEERNLKELCELFLRR